MMYCNFTWLSVQTIAIGNSRSVVSSLFVMGPLTILCYRALHLPVTCFLASAPSRVCRNMDGSRRHFCAAETSFPKTALNANTHTNTHRIHKHQTPPLCVGLWFNQRVVCRLR